ncbi:hypothetical protein B0H16DRAFT_1539275 [Mycena metata]|uniref:RRM domain-containing protein n=1 Tax=Mycena metata TaxID=1033252 RepID=A0AAD7J500_9AGAR|nr:hypothetical protein B0H16DRAFT_1539275 [Mycena metata]
MPRILFVTGFHPSTRARALAYEFERYGALIRCDVPAPRAGSTRPYNPYAFVEFRSTRDAEEAYYDMHGKVFEGSRLSIQWARSPPSAVWRSERGPPRSSRDRDRSRSPRRRAERDDVRDRDRDRDRVQDVDESDRDRDRDSRRSRRSRSPERRRSKSPERRRSRTPERRRSPSPERKREDRDDRARTPPRARDEDEPVKREDDRADTP